MLLSQSDNPCALHFANRWSATAE